LFKKEIGIMAKTISASILIFSFASIHAMTFFGPQDSAPPQRGMLYAPKPPNLGGAKRPNIKKRGYESPEPIVTKMTHLEKMYNFCDIDSVNTLAETYNWDFAKLNCKSKQACGRLRCTGDNHICCPVNGKLNGTTPNGTWSSTWSAPQWQLNFFCISDNEQHRGSCPAGTSHVTHLDYNLAKMVTDDRKMPVGCRRDSECKRNQKCCLNADDRMYASSDLFDEFVHDIPWTRPPTRWIKCYDAEDTDTLSEEQVELGLKTLDDADYNAMKRKMMRMWQNIL